MSLQLTGTLHFIGQEQQVTEKFRKREFVLKIQDGQYEELPKFEMTQDKCSQLDRFETGQTVLVSFNVRGREYSKNGQTSYFTSLQAWRIESVAQGTDHAAAGGYGPSTGAVDFMPDTDDNTLPF